MIAISEPNMIGARLAMMKAVMTGVVPPLAPAPRPAPVVQARARAQGGRAGAARQSPRQASGASMRQQKGGACVLQQGAGDATEHPFAQPRMAVAPGDDQIGIAAPGFREDRLARIGGAQLVQRDLDAVAIE